MADGRPGLARQRSIKLIKVTESVVAPRVGRFELFPVGRMTSREWRALASPPSGAPAGYLASLLGADAASAALSAVSASNAVSGGAGAGSSGTGVTRTRPPAGAMRSQSQRLLRLRPDVAGLGVAGLAAAPAASSATSAALGRVSHSSGDLPALDSNAATSAVAGHSPPVRAGAGDAETAALARDYVQAREAMLQLQVAVAALGRNLGMQSSTLPPMVAGTGTGATEERQPLQQQSLQHQHSQSFHVLSSARSGDALTPPSMRSASLGAPMLGPGAPIIAVGATAAMTSRERAGSGAGGGGSGSGDGPITGSPDSADGGVSAGIMRTSQTTAAPGSRPPLVAAHPTPAASVAGSVALVTPAAAAAVAASAASAAAAAPSQAAAGDTSELERLRAELRKLEVQNRRLEEKRKKAEEDATIAKQKMEKLDRMLLTTSSKPVADAASATAGAKE